MNGSVFTPVPAVPVGAGAAGSPRRPAATRVLLVVPALPPDPPRPVAPPLPLAPRRQLIRCGPPFLRRPTRHSRLSRCWRAAAEPIVPAEPPVPLPVVPAAPVVPALPVVPLCGCCSAWPARLRLTTTPEEASDEHHVHTPHGTLCCSQGRTPFTEFP